MKCLNPVSIFKVWNNFENKYVYTAKQSEALDHTDGFLASCGQCIACRINRARTWSLRCAHEALNHHENSFLTLTYAPEHLPDNLSVSKRHMQLFLKRLRKHLSPKKIRYYACAEYGQPSDLEVNLGLSKVGRPHYHILLFGWYPDDITFFKMGKGQHPLYNSPTLEKIWGKGWVVIGNVSQESAQYVAGYCTKKITGDSQEDHYTRIHPTTGETFQVEPEFQLQSQGIGRDFVDNYPTDLQKGFVTHDGKSYGIPRYYLKRLQKQYDHAQGSEKIRLGELIDKIQLNRENPEFEIIPDFKELTYSYDVAKVYQERSRERQKLNEQF